MVILRTFDPLLGLSMMHISFHGNNILYYHNGNINFSQQLEIMSVLKVSELLHVLYLKINRAVSTIIYYSLMDKPHPVYHREWPLDNAIIYLYYIMTVRIHHAPQ